MQENQTGRRHFYELTKYLKNQVSSLGESPSLLGHDEDVQEEYDYFFPSEYFTRIGELMAPLEAQAALNPRAPLETPLIETVSGLLDDHMPDMLNALNRRGDEFSATDLYDEHLKFLKRKGASTGTIVSAALLHGQNLLWEYGKSRPLDAFHVLRDGFQNLKDAGVVPPDLKEDIAGFVTRNTGPVLKAYSSVGDEDGLVRARVASVEDHEGKKKVFHSVSQDMVQIYEDSLTLLSRTGSAASMAKFIHGMQSMLGGELQQCQQGYELAVGENESELVLKADTYNAWRCYDTSLRRLSEKAPGTPVAEFVNSHMPELMDHLLENDDYRNYLETYGRSVNAFSASPAIQEDLIHAYGTRAICDLIANDASYEAAFMLQRARTELDPGAENEAIVLFDPRDPQNEKPVGALFKSQVNYYNGKLNGSLILLFTENKDTQSKYGIMKDKLYPVLVDKKERGQPLAFVRHSDVPYNPRDESLNEALQEEARIMTAIIRDKDWSADRPKGRHLIAGSMKDILFS